MVLHQSNQLKLEYEKLQLSDCPVNNIFQLNHENSPTL